MKKVNLRDLYPDVYKSDHFVEVTEDVLETIRDSERAEAAYDRRMYRYKAHYSLDCDNCWRLRVFRRCSAAQSFTYSLFFKRSTSSTTCSSVKIFRVAI